MLIDFGKATSKDAGVKYCLSEEEKMVYISKYHHIAPEAVHGEYKQSTYSDIHSMGQLLVKIQDKGLFDSLSVQQRNRLSGMIQNMRSVRFDRRPNVTRCISTN